MEADELAISWKKPFTAAPHEFKIDKLPTGGLTPAQRHAVEEIEAWLKERYDGQVGGISGDKRCPPVGRGWGLTPLTPAPEPPPAPKPDPTPLTQEALRAQLGARFKLGSNK